VITDRPVYRPGSTVQFRVWVRDIRDRRGSPIGQDAKERTESEKAARWAYVVNKWQEALDRDRGRETSAAAGPCAS
jgi:acyl dehydratase